jgi:hypothetical protein
MEKKIVYILNKKFDLRPGAVARVLDELFVLCPLIKKVYDHVTYDYDSGIDALRTDDNEQQYAHFIQVITLYKLSLQAFRTVVDHGLPDITLTLYEAVEINFDYPGPYISFMPVGTSENPLMEVYLETDTALQEDAAVFGWNYSTQEYYEPDDDFELYLEDSFEEDQQ